MKATTFINRVGDWMKIFPTFLFLLLCVSPATSAEKYIVPDFAFPQTVYQNSEASLQQALESGDDIMALRYAINLAISRQLLTNSEASGKSIALIDSVAQKLKPEYKKIAYLLEAEILNQQYSSNQGVYNSRSLPLDSPFPEDPSDWSGEMFKEKILSLVDKATSTLSTRSANINTISLLLTDCKTASGYGMTVDEFIALKGVDLIRRFCNDIEATVIPFYPEKNKSTDSAATIENRCKIKAESLLGQTINDLSGNNSVVKAYSMKQLSSLLPPFEREDYLQKSLTTLGTVEGSGIILYELWNNYGQNNTTYYSQINAWLDRFPEGYGSSRLKSALEEMTRERIEVEVPSVVLPDTSFPAKISVSNLNKGYLLIYKLGNDEYDIYDQLILKNFSGKGKPIETIEIAEAGTQPFSYKKEVNVKGLGAGLYVVIPSTTPDLKNGWNKSSPANYSTFRVSDIAIVTSFNSNEEASGKVYVVKASNQQPIEGAKVEYYSHSSKKQKVKLTTNKEGWVSVPNGYFRIEASYKGSIAKTEAGFSYYTETYRANPHATLLTDLAVYHPGDTIRFAVIGWLQEKSNNSLLKNKKVDIMLRDANYSPGGTLTLTLNEDGRASGQMIIPKGRLLGNYQLTATFPDYKGIGAGSANFLVEEYKLPGFFVKVDQEKGATSDEVKFKGIAQTYAGMPVADADVTVNIEFVPWRWGIFFGNSNPKYSQTTVTNDRGEFELQLPVENLKGTIFENGRYTLTASVTSPTGETQTSSPVFFALRQNYSISPNIPDKLEVTGDSIRFKVTAYGIDGLPEPIELEYKISDVASAEIKLSGKFTSPNLILPASQLPSGEYRLEFQVPGQEDRSDSKTVVWRSSDKSAPCQTPLWVPVGQYTFVPGDKSVDVVFGSYWDDWILMTVSDGEKTLSTEWIKPTTGLTHKQVDIVSDSSTLFINLASMHNLKASTASITIVPKKNFEKLEVKTTSFRNKISAGDKEDWTFQFTLNDRRASSVNVLAVMSDQALNAIRDFNWNLNIWSQGVYNKMHLNISNPRNVYSYRVFSGTSLQKDNYITLLPEWQTYGYPLVSYADVRSGGIRMYKMAAKSRNAMADFAVESAEEEVAEDAAVTQEAPMPASAVAGESGGAESEKVELRPVEVPLAFFLPDLKTDENGDISIKFTVPNFNTTWQLQLAGYDDALYNTTLKMDAVASKPVMVNTNLPQYLRTGDKAEISAAVYNNTEDAQMIGSRLEIIDPISGKVIATQSFDTRNIAPSGSSVVTIGFTVPTDLNVIAVRAYALGADHSDGEEGWIVVLPSSTPVTDATTFYAKSTDNSIDFKIPKLNKDANVTLKYCDNPLWEVIMSLPSLTKETNSSSLSVARWLYGTLLTQNIFDTRSDIADGLRNILDSNDSTISMSNLQKDATLKIVSLQATPWINDASAETSRIRSLEKYFDKGGVDAQISTKIKELIKLQQGDGGFSWFNGMRSSSYITGEIIAIFGYLNQAGLLTSELDKSARKAVKYCDGMILENSKKYKYLDVSGNMAYFYSRNMLGYPMSEPLKKLQNETLDSIASQWRRWNSGEKAMAGMVLMSSPKHKDEASVISKSLEQFLGKNIPLSQEALMLEFFTKIKSEPVVIDRIKEKIFLQKETEAWGDNTSIAGLIHSLVNTISDSDVKRENPEILIAGQKMQLSGSQSLSGNFTINLDPAKVSGKNVTIKRTSGLPAWGGVISQYVQPIKDVKRHKVENLEIEKNLYVENPDGSVRRVNSFKKGDKVRVTLNLACSKDMDYVVIADSRAACLQPAAKVSGLIFVDGLPAYQEVRSDKTSFFAEHLPAGKYVISYECYADRDGDYSLGIAEVQCLYSPAQVAHSAGSIMQVSNR